MTAEDANALVSWNNLGEPALREFIHSLPVAIYATDADGCLTYFNSAAAKLAGRTPEIGRDKWCVTWKLFSANGEPLLHDQCPMAVALRGGEVPAGSQCQAERPDGSRFWFTPNTTVLRDAQNRITGGINVLIENPARNEAQVNAERGNRLLAAIVDSSDDAIISKNLNGIITSWNKSAERLFGYTAPEIVGQSVTILIPPDRQNEEPQILARLRRGDRVEHFETKRRTKDGRLLDISLTISPVRDQTGTIVGASKIARDITESKRTEAEIRRVNRDLEQFAFSASHDLQEPLRTIKIYSELLGRRYGEKLDGEALEFLNYLRAGATRMDVLVRDLLSFTQVTKLEKPLESTDANEALRTALDALRGSISETSAVVTASHLPTVPMHPLHLQQLFQNLIGNAIKYRSKDKLPEVQVSAQQGDGYWIFTTADNGIGIAPEHQENIFGLFKRLHTTDEYSGTGLGLAICRRITDQYQGRIWVESHRGGGSVFRFTIPY